MSNFTLSTLRRVRIFWPVETMSSSSGYLSATTPSYGATSVQLSSAFFATASCALAVL